MTYQRPDSRESRLTIGGKWSIITLLLQAGQKTDKENAGMAELADVQDLGSCAARRVGSTPTTRTKKAGVSTPAFLILCLLVCCKMV